MEASLDSLVNDLSVDELINTRRYLELFEVSKRDGDRDAFDNIRDRAT